MISFYVHVKASFDLNVTRERGVNLNVILEKKLVLRDIMWASSSRCCVGGIRMLRYDW